MRRTLIAAVVISSLCAGGARADVPPFQVSVRGKGPPVVLLPGLTCGARVYDDLARTLCKDHECHLVTLAGFAGVPAIGAPFLPRVRDALVAYVRDHKLERPAVIGHSLGGFLAYWLAATAPERFGPVVVLDGLPFLPAAMNPQATAAGMRAPAEAMRAQMAGQSHDVFVAQVKATLATMIRRPEDALRTAEDAARSTPAAVAQAVYELQTTDLRPLLGKVQARVLVVAAAAFATDDATRKLVQGTYEAQVAAIPRHEVVLARDARHFVMLDEPELVRQLVVRHLGGGK